MKELYSGIFIIENFLTEEEQKYHLDLINSCSAEDWTGLAIKEIEDSYQGDSEKIKYEVDNRNTYWDDKVIIVPNEQLNNIIENRISKIFNDEFKITNVGRIQRQYPGSELQVHYDQGSNPTLQKAVLIYLNDDYNGGELFFPDHNFSIKPPARSLITFPGTKDYLHGVKILLDGPDRFVLPYFGFTK